MSLRVIGAGLGRTGTSSLKLALELLLGGRCYHMMEVFPRPADIPIWHAAACGGTVDWQALCAGFTAAIDWPACAFWEPLSVVYPEALIVLSTRPAEAWWRSASETIFPAMLREDNDWRRMIDAVLAHNGITDVTDKAHCIAAYESHNARVRERAPAARLLEWQPGAGWEPLCAALGADVPDTPFPHANSTAEFTARHLSKPA